jgi:hypothetical protein
MAELPDLSGLTHEQKDALIRALWAQVQALTARVAELEARLGAPPKTPDNSSLPPSKGQKPNRPEKGKRHGPRLGRMGGGRWPRRPRGCQRPAGAVRALPGGVGRGGPCPARALRQNRHRGFAVQTIRRWWAEIGSTRYPDAMRLVITADGPYVSLGGGWSLLQPVFNHPRLAPETQPSTRYGFDSGFTGAGSFGWGLGNGIRLDLEGTYAYNAVNSRVRTPLPGRTTGNQNTYGVFANVYYDVDWPISGSTRPQSSPSWRSAPACCGRASRRCRAYRATATCSAWAGPAPTSLTRASSGPPSRLRRFRASSSPPTTASSASSPIPARWARP